MDENIKQLLLNYRPNQSSIDILKATKLVIFAGVTSAGKNTIMNRLVDTGEYHDVVTSTTRAPRANNGVMEVDKVDYYFLSTEQAVQKLKNGEYIEVAPVHERINGVLVEELERVQGLHKTAVIDVDVQGVDTFEKLSEAVISIFVIPPSFEEWVRRMRQRYPSAEEFDIAWPVRRESAIMELEMALSKPYYHFIINENIDDAVASAIQIIDGNDVFNEADEKSKELAKTILNDLKSELSE